MSLSVSEDPTVEDAINSIRELKKLKDKSLEGSNEAVRLFRAIGEQVSVDNNGIIASNITIRHKPLSPKAQEKLEKFKKFVENGGFHD